MDADHPGNLESFARCFTCHRLATPQASPLRPRLGGLCQATTGRAASRARLSRALHAPGGDFQRAHRRHRERPGGVPGAGRCRRPETYAALAGWRTHCPLLLHVLPSGFKRIRHYGLLSPARKKVGLTAARTALAVSPPEGAIIESVAAFLCRLARLESMCCPHCGGPFRITSTLLPLRGATARGPP